LTPSFIPPCSVFGSLPSHENNAKYGEKIEENPDDRDPESRVNAARALRSVCCELFSGEEGNEVAAMLLGSALEGLLLALDDYSCDNRGDVGSWVREVRRRQDVALISVSALRLLEPGMRTRV
jgi:hypothetical protein